MIILELIDRVPVTSALSTLDVFLYLSKAFNIIIHDISYIV